MVFVHLFQGGHDMATQAYVAVANFHINHILATQHGTEHWTNESDNERGKKMDKLDGEKV